MMFTIVRCRSPISASFLYASADPRDLHSFPTRRSSDLWTWTIPASRSHMTPVMSGLSLAKLTRSEEHTSELQSRGQLVCRLLLEKKKLTMPLCLLLRLFVFLLLQLQRFSTLPLKVL